MLAVGLLSLPPARHPWQLPRCNETNSDRTQRLETIVEFGRIQALQRAAALSGLEWKLNDVAPGGGCLSRRRGQTSSKGRGLSVFECLSDLLDHSFAPFDKENVGQRRSTVAGISPEDSGKLKSEQGLSKQMDDVSTANFLVSEIAYGKRNVGDMLHTAWKELSRRFPHRDEPEKRWTERRLRGWWNNESQIVRHFQMVELYDTAEALRKARDEHAEYRAKTAAIRQMAQLVAANEARGLAER